MTTVPVTPITATINADADRRPIVIGGTIIDWRRRPGIRFTIATAVIARTHGHGHASAQ
jgi:hypothetical protein